MLKQRTFHARSMSEAGLSRFRVSGGPFAREQEFGWQITDEKGMTVAVSPDHTFVSRLNMLEKFFASFDWKRVEDELPSTRRNVILFCEGCSACNGGIDYGGWYDKSVPRWLHSDGCEALHVTHWTKMLRRPRRASQESR